MFSTRKIIAAAAIGAIVSSAALAGCSQQGVLTSNNNSSKHSSTLNSNSSASNTAKANTNSGSKENLNSNSHETVTGGWQSQSAPDSLLSDDEAELFASADGSAMFYDPIALIAEKSGFSSTSYAFLCEMKSLGTGRDAQWAIVTLEGGKGGNAKMVDTEVIKAADIAVKKTAASDGWEAKRPSKSGIEDKEALKAWKSALSGASDVDAEAVAVLSSQVVAGTNYEILCVGKTAKGQKDDAVYIATVYEPLKGEAEISKMALLDLDYYTSGDSDEGKNTNGNDEGGSNENMSKLLNDNDVNDANEHRSRGFNGNYGNDANENKDRFVNVNDLSDTNENKEKSTGKNENGANANKDKVSNWNSENDNKNSSKTGSGESLDV